MFASAHPGTGLVVTKDGTCYFVDSVRNRVMKLAHGQLSVLYADPTRRTLGVPHHLYLLPDGDLITVGDERQPPLRITPKGVVTEYFRSLGKALPIIGEGGDPFVLAPDGSLIYVTSDGAWKIWSLKPDGSRHFIAGGGTPGKDGKGAVAGFGPLHFSGMSFGPDGSLYVTDNGSRVRRISKDGVVTTVAGSATRGYKDGKGSVALFDMPVGLAVANDGTIYVAEYANRRIRKIAPDGTVTTFAGTGARGDRDGPAATATFEDLSGVALGPNGSLYTYEWRAGDAPCIRVIDSHGTVKTLTYVKP